MSVLGYVCKYLILKKNDYICMVKFQMIFNDKK